MTSEAKLKYMRMIARLEREKANYIRLICNMEKSNEEDGYSYVDEILYLDDEIEIIDMTIALIKPMLD